MRIFGWDIEFETGIKKFDDNNKIIIVLLNKLLKIFHEEKMSPEFHKVYATVLMYAKKEFKLEETLMKKAKYEQFKIHCNQHSEFINKMEYFANQYLMGEALSFEFQKYATKWVESHIQVTDKKMIATVKDYILNTFDIN